MPSGGCLSAGSVIQSAPIPAVLQIVGSLHALWRRRSAIRARALDTEGFLQISALASSGAFLLALLRVTYVYRTYITFKFIYLLPALYGFAVLYVQGWRILEKRHPRLFRVLATTTVLLVVVHAVDLSWLIYDLAKQN